LVYIKFYSTSLLFVCGVCSVYASGRGRFLVRGVSLLQTVHQIIAVV